MQQCGKEGQRPCTVIERIPSCDRGLVEDFRLKKCVRPASSRPACGGNGQRPCTVTERIPSCDRGLKEDFGLNKCVSPASLSCGGRGQRPCLVTERVPSCNRGLVEDFKVNKCLIYNESSGREFEQFAQKFMQDNKASIDALVEFVLSLSNNKTKTYFSSGRFRKDVEQRRFNDVEIQTGVSKLRQRLKEVKNSYAPKSITIGIVADGGVGIGGNIETGIAINLTPLGGVAEMYRTFGVSMGLITGGSGSIAVSFWKDTPQNFVGEARGLSFGAGKVVNPATGISVGGGLGFWFAPLQNFPGAIGFDYRQFIGLSAFVGVGASVLPVDLRGTSALTQIYKDPKWYGGNCGESGGRPCHAVERVPSCNRGLKEDFIKHQCVR